MYQIANFCGNAENRKRADRRHWLRLETGEPIGHKPHPSPSTRRPKNCGTEFARTDNCFSHYPRTHSALVSSGRTRWRRIVTNLAPAFGGTMPTGAQTTQQWKVPKVKHKKL
jgi:hypothetical protein